MESFPGFGIQKTCPFPLNRGVPSIEVTDSQIMWTFFRDQILCPGNRRVPKKRTHHWYSMPMNICSLGLSVFDESNWVKVPSQFLFLQILMLFLMKGTF